MTRHAVPSFIRIFAALSVAACSERDWSDLFADPVLEGAAASAGVAGGGESEHSLEGVTVPPSNAGGAPGGTKDSNTAGVASSSVQESAGGSGDEPSVPEPSGASGGSAGEPEPSSTAGGGGSSSGGGISGAAGKGGESAGGTENGGSAGDGTVAGAGGPGGSAASAGSSACPDGARETCDGLDNDCDGEVDEHDACPSGCIGHAHDGVTGYMFCKEADFDDALELCRKSDMHLAWIETAEENDMLLSAATHLGISGEGLRIGGSDREHEGEWRWVDSNGHGQIPFWSGDSALDGGKAVDAQYTNWGENRPNDRTMSSAEDCLTFALDRSDFARGTWNDDGCEGKWPFVCEK